MKIILTGATGYIGKKLLPNLLETGHTARDSRGVQEKYSNNERVILVKSDLLDKSSLDKIPKDIDIPYYFVHSMGSSKTDFAKLERL